MRLWHEDLIRKLPINQLKGQHRECCALRGKNWGRKHSTIDYIFKHDFEKLLDYHYKIMLEMKRRQMTVGYEWILPNYRGKRIGFVDYIDMDKVKKNLSKNQKTYEEHNEEYYKECIDNLASKNIFI